MGILIQQLRESPTLASVCVEALCSYSSHSVLVCIEYCVCVLIELVINVLAIQYPRKVGSTGGL